MPPVFREQPPPAPTKAPANKIPVTAATKENRAMGAGLIGE
jgi:hypothetical protein